MRLHTSIALTALFVACGLATTGCKSKKRSSSSATAVAPTTSGATTTPTTSTTTGSTTAPTNTASTTPPLAAPTTGGNTSSGSASSGATSAGFGAGTGVFTDATANLPTSSSNDYGADAGDLDGDGDIDVVIAVQGAPSRILWNDGQARFSLRANSLPAVTMAATDVRLIDIENDGDFDLVFAANFQPARLFKNDGAGNFTLAGTFNDTNDAYTYKLAVGDANGDGYADVFLAQAGQSVPSRGQNKLFLNDQAGGLAEAPLGTLPVKYDDSLDATFLDANGDGALDIFVANFGTSHSMLVNDGAGRFANQTDVYLPPALTRYGTAIAQGDLDRDGDIDLFVANEGAPGAGTPPPGEVNTYLRNNGAGMRFTDLANQVPTDAEATWKLRLVDVNSDGWLDVVASQLRAVQRLYVNSNGVLVDATQLLPARNQTPSDSFGLTIGDFNGDRAPDIIFVRRNAQPWLFLNRP